MYGEGISKVGEVVDLGVDHDIIQKSGAGYSYDTAKIAQGREASKQFMMDNPEVALEIEQKIKNKITGVAEPAEEDDAGAKGKSTKNAVKVSED